MASCTVQDSLSVSFVLRQLSITSNWWWNGMHEKPGGNSGVFVWTTPDSIERLPQPESLDCLTALKCRCSIILSLIA